MNYAKPKPPRVQRPPRQGCDISVLLLLLSAWLSSTGSAAASSRVRSFVSTPSTASARARVCACVTASYEMAQSEFALAASCVTSRRGGCTPRSALRITKDNELTD